MKRNEKSKKDSTDSFISNNYITIVTLIIGICIGALVMSFFPRKVAALKDGTEPIVSFNNEKGETVYITADDLYNNMKSYYSVSSVIDNIDKNIFDGKYEVTAKEEEYIDTQVKQFEETAKGYNTTVEYLLSYYGYESMDDLKNILSLNYRRNFAVTDYLKSELTDKEIQDYYDKSVYGDVYLKYITVASSDDETTNNKAKELIKEIQEKVSNGSSYSSIVKSYKKKITYKDFGYVAFDNTEVDQTIKTELEKLENNSSSKEYITTSTGYTIVFRGESKDKKALDDIKDRVKDMVVATKEYDENISNKALIAIREKYAIKFIDTDYETKYAKYIKDTNKPTESTN